MPLADIFFDPLIALSIGDDEIIKMGFCAKLAAFLNVAQRKSLVMPFICGAIITSSFINFIVNVLYSPALPHGRINSPRLPSVCINDFNESATLTTISSVSSFRQKVSPRRSVSSEEAV